MIAINPLYDRNDDIEDSGPMFVGLSEYLGVDNDSSTLENPRDIAIFGNAFSLKASELLLKADELLSELHAPRFTPGESFNDDSMQA